MRRFVARPLTMLLAFGCGLLLTLLCRGVVQDSARRLALRAEERIKAPYVTEGEDNFRKRRILLDLRDKWDEDDDGRPVAHEYDDLEALGDQRDDREKRILPKLFPGGYLEIISQCETESRWPPASSADDLARVRQRGQFVPHLPHWKDGHFTEPGAFQTLYVVDLCECNSWDSQQVQSTRILAVFDRWDRLYAWVEALPGEGIYAVRDVDADGVDEVLLGHGEMRGTNYVSLMRLVSLRDGNLRVVHDFGIGYVYSLRDEPGRNRIITIPVVYYTPRGDGETPEFQSDFYRADCAKDEGCGFFPKPSAWQFYKSGPLTEADMPRPGPEWTLPLFNTGHLSPPHP